ncbi:hypothetical protein [Methylosinus sporium]|uniref:BufA2 family periplasmic bufferin-type metallophore n=1 Tax=Methylosinus sporium TaxID=428 RepID=UPI003839EA4C
MKMSIISGGSLAAAAVALVLAGAGAPASAKKAHRTVRCFGVNSCRGHSACKSAHNSCKGQNSCKGHGWLPAKSEAACEAQGGALG